MLPWTIFDQGFQAFDTDQQVRLRLLDIQPRRTVGDTWIIGDGVP